MAIDLGRDNVRQLTFTSSDSSDGRPGGWGVKETSVAMSSDEVDYLKRGLVTQLDPVVELSQFPSNAELDGRPRQLICEPARQRVALWHTVPAGPDRTGRPGNVFIHAALVAPRSPLMRPIELWRSPGWLTPYGPAEVAAATLPETLPTGSAITRQSTLRFILDGQPNRVRLLRCVLDAAVDAAQSGRTLVLRTTDVDEAAAWIGALSFLGSAAYAHNLSWSTFCRLADLPGALSRGLAVVAVPQGEDDTDHVLDAWSEQITLISTDRLDVESQGSDADLTWILPSGRRIPSTRWQALVVDLAFTSVTGGSERAEAILASHDELSAAAHDAPPYWPLAVAMLEAGVINQPQRFETLRETLLATPTALREDAAITTLLAEFRAADATEEVWREPEPAPEPVPITLPPPVTHSPPDLSRVLAYVRDQLQTQLILRDPVRMPFDTVELPDDVRVDLLPLIDAKLTRAASRIDDAHPGVDARSALTHAIHLANFVLSLGPYVNPDFGDEATPMEQISTAIGVRLSTLPFSERTDLEAAMSRALHGWVGRVPEAAEVAAATNPPVAEPAPFSTSLEPTPSTADPLAETRALLISVADLRVAMDRNKTLGGHILGFDPNGRRPATVEETVVYLALRRALAALGPKERETVRGQIDKLIQGAELDHGDYNYSDPLYQAAAAELGSATQAGGQAP